MKYKSLFFVLLLIPSLAGTAYAHTVDSVGDYRLEIGWLHEPTFSGEFNAVELYVSPLTLGLELEQQEFKNGIIGLEETLKMQLVKKDQKITLQLEPDHNIPGKYYAFVIPGPGFYQANVLGDIKDTKISLSMHPPKVDEREYIEFPPNEDVTINQIIDAHTVIVGDINDLKESIKDIEQANSQSAIGYIGIVIGAIGIGIAAVALSKTKRN